MRESSGIVRQFGARAALCWPLLALALALAACTERTDRASSADLTYTASALVGRWEFVAPAQIEDAVRSTESAECADALALLHSFRHELAFGADGEATEFMSAMGYADRKRYRWECQRQDGDTLWILLTDDSGRVSSRVFRLDGGDGLLELRGAAPTRCFRRI